MKKKTVAIVGAAVLGAALIVGNLAFAEDTKEAKPHPNAVTKVGAKAPIQLSEDQIIDSFEVEKTEFSTVESMVEDFTNSLKPDSEYLSYQSKETAVYTLANAALHYVNYFEEDIAELGLTEDFEEWQRIAYEIRVNEKEGKSTIEFRDQFESKLNELSAKL